MQNRPHNSHQMKPRSIPNHASPINNNNTVGNLVQNQRHSYKRSEHGPMPTSNLKHKHRRLATTVEQYD